MYGGLHTAKNIRELSSLTSLIQPALRETPSHVTLHVGANDMTAKQDPQQITEKYHKLSSQNKKEHVSVSSITAKNDKYLRKVADVNRNLKDMCRGKNFHFINHGNAITVRHLIASKLHLNEGGTKILSNQFAEAISNIIN